MKTFPSTKDEQLALVVFPFKVYIILAYPFLMVCIKVRSLFEQPRFLYLLRNPAHEATYAVSTVYFLCLVVLLVGALVQSICCQRGRALQTIGFFVVGCFIFWSFRPWGTIG
jgi:hypothetical protein